jgi:hypothetical protein
MYFSAKNYQPLQWVIFISLPWQVNSIIQQQDLTAPSFLCYMYLKQREQHGDEVYVKRKLNKLAFISVHNHVINIAE